VLKFVILNEVKNLSIGIIIRPFAGSGWRTTFAGSGWRTHNPWRRSPDRAR